jgi:hypothetical protein
MSHYDGWFQVLAYIQEIPLLCRTHWLLAPEKRKRVLYA